MRDKSLPEVANGSSPGEVGIVEVEHALRARAAFVGVHSLVEEDGEPIVEVLKHYP